MFSSDNYLPQVEDVPSEWIFEKYILGKKIVNQKASIKSLFNPGETVGSLKIYYSRTRGKYLFKDFSSGNRGDALDLLMFIEEKSFKEVAEMVLFDYYGYVKDRHVPLVRRTRNAETVASSKWIVSDYQTRGWTVTDRDYWSSYNIGSCTLEHFNVKGLKYYEISIDGKGFTIVSDNIYGYFTKDGDLYKIYQPKNKGHKFIKVMPYIQGTDQLGSHDTLMLTSSLKDTMTMFNMNLDMAYLSPDSENTMLSDEFIADKKATYKYVLSLFDNDPAGLKAMVKYMEHGIPYIHLTISKDISDAVQKNNSGLIKTKLVPLIAKAKELYYELQKTENQSVRQEEGVV